MKCVASCPDTTVINLARTECIEKTTCTLNGVLNAAETECLVSCPTGKDNICFNHKRLLFAQQCLY